MTRILTIVAVLVAALSVTGAASAGEWRHFENQTFLCSIARPGGAQGATCVVKSGRFHNWGFIIQPYEIQVTNAQNHVVFRKKTLDDTPGPAVSWSSWTFNNEGVACRKQSYTVACMVKTGGLLGWAILAQDDLIEITNLDNAIKFKRGS